MLRLKKENARVWSAVLEVLSSNDWLTSATRFNDPDEWNLLIMVTRSDASEIYRKGNLHQMSRAAAALPF